MQADVEHMFAIRSLQSRIRRLWAEGGTLPNQDNMLKCRRTEIRAELDQWKAMIPFVSSTVDGSMNYHPLAMLKMYNCSVCCLYQHETYVPSIADYTVLLSADFEL
ncbi:hypothetical protein FOXG_22496 [Fusarium oxysporum f. sp. lycopersici 4287]|uniref:Uncharacterized protein n=1 Tax=Fusarium oxysporum f. sp. lycopersici (strain 4287 / CBS 123668 / FGSC 9935 / NRRL 34936) TaxID=426428 RepID=A0A0J9W7U7_FUSO4|nr:hypothetical protein FOXG_22496 [Fusarium oxysporum f. sp. lycopersici 4287]KNB19254.1 hypothetical protein FOXG_22496 [Fusarium oxysporum f. sp. lycopersici 4287]